MSKDIELQVAPRFLEDKTSLIRRLARIVAYDDQHVVEKQKVTFECWGLDIGNNWLAMLRDDILTVRYRYGGGTNEEMMSGLQKFLQWQFGKQA